MSCLMFIQSNIFNAAVQIIRKRFHFMELLQKWAEPIHLGISRGIETLEVILWNIKRLGFKQTGRKEMEDHT